MNRRRLILANNPLLSGPRLEEREMGGVPYREIPVSLIDRDPQQPRTVFDEAKINELAESIKLYGVISPVVVRPSVVAGRYVIVAGERRLRAAKIAGLAKLPAIIDQGTGSDEGRTISMQLVENLQRADLSPFDRAQAINLMRDRYNLSVREIAEKLGISKSMVQRSLDLLSMPADCLMALKDGAPESTVAAIARINDEKERAELLSRIDSITRTEVESRRVSVSSYQRDNQGKNQLTLDEQRIVDDLQRSLGLKVKLVKSRPDSDAGRLLIEFYSADDLQLVCRRLLSDELPV